MKYRYTQDDIDKFSDRRFLECLITERISGLNPYGPLRRRLYDIRKKLQNDEPLELYAANHSKAETQDELEAAAAYYREQLALVEAAMQGQPAKPRSTDDRRIIDLEDS